MSSDDDDFRCAIYVGGKKKKFPLVKNWHFDQSIKVID